MTRSRTRQQQHVIQILGARPPFGGIVEHGWQCTCGDHEVFSGACSLRSAWTTAQMHAKIWRGVIA